MKLRKIFFIPTNKNIIVIWGRYPTSSVMNMSHWQFKTETDEQGQTLAIHKVLTKIYKGIPVEYNGGATDMVSHNAIDYGVISYNGPKRLGGRGLGNLDAFKSSFGLE